jgi:hypothetical protein
MEKKKKRTKKKRDWILLFRHFSCHYCPNFFPIDENILKGKKNHHPLSTGQKFELIWWAAKEKRLICLGSYLHGWERSPPPLGWTNYSRGPLLSTGQQFELIRCEGKEKRD